MLETKRCSIKPFQESDAVDVQQLYTNQEVRKYLGGIRQEDSINEVLNEMLHPSKDSFYWTVREKMAGEFIGLVSLDPHHEDDIEISYQFLPDWWGKGYAAEVVQKIIHYALNELKLERLVAETQTANTASCRLLERVGMKFEKTVIRFGEEQSIYSI